MREVVLVSKEYYPKPFDLAKMPSRTRTRIDLNAYQERRRNESWAIFDIFPDLKNG